MLSLSPLSGYEVKPKTVAIEPCAKKDCNDSYMEPVKNIAMGVCKTAMAFWTFANLKFLSPGLPILDQRPSIQGFCEKAAFHLGLNPVHPDVMTELYLPASPVYRDKFTIPMTDYSFTMPFLKFPVETIHSFTDPTINKRILRKHRDVEFAGGPAGYDVMFNLLKTIFPEEKKFERDDFLLTSGTESTKKVHKAIIKALNTERLDQIIQIESRDLIDRWESEENINIDISKEMQLFTAAVITRAMFDDSSHSQELCEAISFMNYYLYAKVMGIIKEVDTEIFNLECMTFRNVIDKILEGKNVDSLPLFANEEFTLNEKRGLCLMMFLAGQETTAFVLAHVLAELALNPDKQKTFEGMQYSEQSPEFKKFVDNLLMKIPPTNGVSRKAKEEYSYISYECENGDAVRKYIKKDERLLVNINGTAQNVHNEFAPKPADASVFGENGVHQCVGKAMALRQLYKVPPSLLEHLKLTTNETEFKFTTQATKQAKPFFVKVERRVDPISPDDEI